MTYRCKNCGYFIKRDAKVCKHCGMTNPVIEEVVKAQATKEPFVRCQCCHARLYYTDDLDDEKLLICSECGAHVINPYYNKYAFLHKNKNTIAFWTVFGLFVIFGSIYSSRKNNNSQNAVPQLSEEWKESAQNQEFDYGGEVSLSDEVLYELETAHGRTFNSVFEKYLNRPIGNQAILNEEPLRSLLIKTVGEDGVAIMMKCRKSEVGLEKNVTDHVKYTYDCYMDTPNGNYFSMAFLSDSKKAFFLEMKVNGTMYNVAISEFN